MACEQLSLAATQVLLKFPANPGSPSTGSLSEPQVILAGFDTVAPPTNFGVPAAYFYGLSAQLPLQISTPQRFKLATGDVLEHLLAALTSAIHSGTITDAEPFVLVAGKINGAQAARRIAALGIPAGTSIPLAPLDSLALQTLTATSKGDTLAFASTVGVKLGMSVSGANIADGTTVGPVPPPTSVKLSAPVLGVVSAGDNIVFTPVYSAGLTTLVQSWLKFPTSVVGVPSTDSYQPGDDDTKFWPTAASAQPADFLGLVLSRFDGRFHHSGSSQCGAG